MYSEKEMSESTNKQKNNSGLKIAAVLFVAAIWLIDLIIIALLLLPAPSPFPEFEIIDNNGQWEAQGTIAVFDETIHPDTHGEYNFIISNTSDAMLEYVFKLEEKYVDRDEEWPSFMKYRLRMNGQHMETTEWFSAEELVYSGILILPKTKQLMTLEWWWPFEGGNDGNDTWFGNDAGKFSVVFHLTAEVVE